MNKLISPGTSIRNSSFLPAIKDKENKYPDSTITMNRSRRCVNTYHVEQGKVYFPFYKLTGDGKSQNKSVHFDLDELRKLLKSNIDTYSIQDIEPIPDKCINHGSSVVSIITPTLKIYPTESASQSGEITTIMTKEPTIASSAHGSIADSSQNKILNATKNIASHRTMVSPSNLYTIRSSNNNTPTAESSNSTVDGSKPAVDNIDPTTGTITPTTDSNTPTTENITPAMSNATLTNQILVAPTVSPTINIVDYFLSAAVASTSIGRLRNDLVKLQQAYPQANIATLLAAVDETLAFYKFVSLITTLSFFIDTIKDAHPEAAGYYKNQLKTLLSTINQHYDKKSTSDRTKRAPWQFSEVLSNLVKFESAPMKAEMLSFFKGFEETRVELINAVNSGFSVSPELRTLIDTLQSSDENIVNLMRQINKETADLLTESNYYRVGRLAFKANILTESSKVDSVFLDLNTEIKGALKNTFSELIGKYSNLQSIPSGMNINVPLDEVLSFSFSYDPLQIARLANSISEGFCRADTILSAISSQQGTLFKSLDNMVQSVFNGVGYAKYPYQMRFFLHENFYSDNVRGLNNVLSSVGAKSESIQLKNAQAVFDDYYLSEKKVPFKSAEDLLFKAIIDGYRELIQLKIDPESPIQLFIRPKKGHVVYMEVKGVDTGFRLTYQDIQTGLKVVNGNSLSSLYSEATKQLREVFEHYQIPLTDADAQSMPSSSIQGLTITTAFNSQAQLDRIGQLQIIPDSALTVKDVVTHDISELQALDTKAIKSMFEEYTKLLTDSDNQKKLKLDNLGDKLPDLPASSTQIDRSDHLISQVREVIATLKNSAQTGRPIPDSIKLLNAHIVLDVVKYSIEKPSTSNPDQPSGNAGDSKILRMLNVPDTLPTGPTDTATLMQMAAIRDFVDIFDSGVHQLKRKLSDQGGQPNVGKEAKKTNVDKPVEENKQPDPSDGGRDIEDNSKVELSSLDSFFKALAAAAEVALAILYSASRTASSQQVQQLANPGGGGGNLPNLGGGGGGNLPNLGGGGVSCGFLCKLFGGILIGLGGLGILLATGISEAIGDAREEEAEEEEKAKRRPSTTMAPTRGVAVDAEQPIAALGTSEGAFGSTKIIAAVADVPETRFLTLGSTTGDSAISSTPSASAATPTPDDSTISPTLSIPEVSQTSSAINSTLSTPTVSSTPDSSAISLALSSMEGTTTLLANQTRSPIISSLPIDSRPAGVHPPGFFLTSSGPDGLETSGTSLAGVTTELVSSALSTTGQGTASAVDTTATASEVSLSPATIDSELSPPVTRTIPKSSTPEKATSTPCMPVASDSEGHVDFQEITNTFNNITADLYNECKQNNQRITNSLKLNDYGSAREDHRPSSVELHQNYDLCIKKQFILADAVLDYFQNNKILIAKSNCSFIEVEYPRQNEVDLIPGSKFVPDEPSDTHKIHNLLFKRLSYVLQKGFLDVSLSKVEIAGDIANSFRKPFYYNAIHQQQRESYAAFSSDIKALLNEPKVLDKQMVEVENSIKSFEKNWVTFWKYTKMIAFNRKPTVSGNIVALDFTHYQADMHQRSVDLFKQLKNKFTSAVQIPKSYPWIKAREHAAGNSRPIEENHDKAILFNNTLPENLQDLSQPELRELIDVDSMQARQLYDDYVQNLEEESARAENPEKGTIISGTQVFRNSFEIHALDRLREGNNVVYDVGTLFLGLLLDSAPAAERQKKMREISGVKELLLHQQMSSLQRMYDAYFTIRSNITMTQQVPAGISSGSLDRVTGYTAKFKTDTEEVLSKAIEGISATDTANIDAYLDDKKYTLLQLRNTMINDLQSLSVAQKGSKSSSAQRRLTQSAGDLVQETTEIASKCLSLFKQIAFDLKTRFNDPEVYKTRDLIPADLLDSSDDQIRKRRDVASSDENVLLNNDWQDSALADQDIPDLLEPAHSSGSSLHSGISSGIRARLSGLASFAGFDSPVNLARTGYVPSKQESIHGSSPGQEGQALRAQPLPYSPDSSLILANVMAAAMNDRPLRTVDHQALSNNRAVSLASDPLGQSPGMKLLEGSRRIAGRMQAEVTDYVQALTNNAFTEVATCWQPEDLLNIAIVQTAGSADPDPATEAFLQTVLTSAALGVEHESPDNIFRSDGTVRKVAVGADGQSSIFFDSVTGKTTADSPSIELARCMLQAMAQHQLKNHGTQGLSPSFSKKVLDQARWLHNRQPESIASQLGNWLGISENKAEQQLDKRLSELFAATHQPIPDTIHSIALIQSLDMGNYQDTRQQFMELLPEQQLAILQSLARAPDPLGLDQSSEYLAQWQNDMRKLPYNSDNNDRSVPDWSAFAIDQRAWQLFSYLYDCKVSGPQEALSRVQLSSAINQRQITDDDDEALEVSRVVTALLPVVSSTSESTSIEPGSVNSLQPPVQCHQFSKDNIDRMLDAYSAIKKQVKGEFPRVFGHTIHDPQLQQELTGQVAIACLEVLKGRLSDSTEHWQSIVKNVLEEEFAEFNGLSSG